MPLKCAVYKKDPLVLLVYGEGEVTVNDVDDFVVFFNGHLAGQQQFKTLFDLRKVDTASRQVVMKLGKCISGFEIKAVGKVLANAVVIDNKPIEAILNLLFSFNQPTTPTKVTHDLSIACEFLDNY